MCLIEKTASGSGGPHGCNGGVPPPGRVGSNRPSYQGETWAGGDRITWARPGPDPARGGGNERRFSLAERADPSVSGTARHYTIRR